MKQVARTLARRKNTSKTSLITNQVLVRGDAAAKKDSASQQGPLIVFETREKRRPAILQAFKDVVLSALAKWSRRQPKVGSYWAMYVYLSVFMRLIIFHSLYSAALEIELTPHQT